MQSNSWTDYSPFFQEDSLVAGFTNRNFLHSTIDDRIKFAQTLELDHLRLVIPQQIHSGNVVICTRTGMVSETDGMVTFHKNLILSIQVADCIPIFLFDEQRHIIGLIHAGWRGISSGIVENAVNMMQQLNSDPANIKVLLGPSIRNCCFEIGCDVGDLFDSRFQSNGQGDKMQLDLQGVASNKFIQMNLQSNNIIDAKECTCCSENYHSFRRNGQKAGRMIALFGWQKK